MRLSIIIPYYNTKRFTDELLKGLIPQRTKEVEIIIVDDGSDSCYYCEFEGVKIIRQKNGGVSSARNTGLQKAKGEYIVFIDSDDLVSDDYIEQIFKAIESNPDTVYISWKSIDNKHGKIIQSERDEFNPYNRCVWNRVFKREYIDGLYFDTKFQIAEDDDFLKRLPVAKSKTYISKPIYIYRNNREGSLTYRARNKDFNPDGTEKPRIKTQVVVYCADMQKIGGIETWVYYWCQNMHKLYDIMVVFANKMDGRQIARLSEIVQVMRLSDNRIIECDTLINTRITDHIPTQIQAKKIIQMVHGCYSILFCCDIQPERDKVVCVSQVVADSYKNLKDYEVIHNFTYPEAQNQCLFLITASRFTREKGGMRYLKLARQLKNSGIDFKWFFFSHQNESMMQVFDLDEKNKELKENIVFFPETINVKGFIGKCDYLVQLSDSEGFGYSIVEALEMGVPVITTPVEVLTELGFQDGKDGYVVPFDMNGIDVQRFLKVPKPNFVWNNEKISKQWVKMLGRSKPTGEYLKQGGMMKIKIIESYSDMELGRDVAAGEVITMRRARALLIVGCGKAVIVK